MKKKKTELKDETLKGNFYSNKKFKKNAMTIFGINVAIFAILCTIVFVIVFLPLIMWLYSESGNITFNDFLSYLTVCVLVGGPVIVVTALYGGLLFWILLVRFVHFEHQGHKIDIYLGVKKIAFAVDGKMVGYAQHGVYSVPHVVWITEVDKCGIKLEVFKKNDYKLEINYFPVNVQHQDIKISASKPITIGTHK